VDVFMKNISGNMYKRHSSELEWDKLEINETK